MDHIFLEALSVDASVGLLDWEKTQRQPISIDCVCYINSCREAAVNNDVTQSVDYAAMRDTILGLIEASHYELLESLAEVIAERMFELSELVLKVSISIRKTAIFPDVKGVGVNIVRQNMNKYHAKQL